MRGVVLLLVALSAIAMAQNAHAARRPRAMTASAARHTIQLVETRPLETALGDTTAPAAAGVWVAMIDSARTTIDIEHFYCSTYSGEPLDAVITALGRAAARGVRIRMILDARMHRTYPQPADSLAALPHIAVRLLSMSPLSGVQHAKFFIVDGARFFLGSQNFDWRALGHIHELGVRVDDAALAKQLRSVFEEDWARSLSLRTGQAVPGAARPPRAALSPVTWDDGTQLALTASPLPWLADSSEWDRDAIVRLLDGARRSIVVQVLTYSPSGYGTRDAALQEALLRAARRGVDVKLLVSEWVTGEDDGMDALRALAREPHIAVSLSTLPAWSGGYIPFARVEHLKYAVADDSRLWLGTSNWDPSYFHTSRNIGLSCDSPALAAQAARIFARSWSAPSAAPLDPARTYTPLGHGLIGPDGKPSRYN